MSHPSRRDLFAGVLCAFVLAFSFHAWLEFQVEPLRGADGWYHTKVAELYRTGQLDVGGGDFPWMRFGLYNDLRHDWQLGYHLLLVPFVGAAGLVTGGKLSIAFFAALLTAVLHLLLRAERAPFAWLLTVLFACSSSVVNHRWHFVRPTALTVTLVLVLVYVVARQRPWPALAATLALMLVYNVPHTPLVVAAMAAVVLTLSHDRLPVKTVAAVLAGVVLGVVLHPGMWHWRGDFFGPDHANLAIWRQMGETVEVAQAGNQLSDADGTVPVPLGIEFRAAPTSEIRAQLLLPLLVVGAALALALWRRRRPGPVALLALATGVVYLYLFLDFPRFRVYWVPLGFVAAGALLRDALGDDFATGTIASGSEVADRRLGIASALLGAVAAVTVAAQVVVLASGAAPLASLDRWWPAVILLMACLYRAALPPLAAGISFLRGRPHQPRALLAAALVAALAVVAGTEAWLHLKASVVGQHYPLALQFARYRDAAVWLRDGSGSEPGDVVYNQTWDAFHTLFHYNHKNHYVVGFDPLMLYFHDPALYRLWHDVGEGKLRGAELVAALARFDARFVLVSTRDKRAFREAAVATPELVEVYDDGFATVYETAVGRSTPATGRPPRPAPSP